MIKVSVEVRKGTARFQVGVRAESIRRALSAVGARYPTSDVRVAFPIEPEDFFVSGSSLAEMVEPKHPKQLAA